MRLKNNYNHLFQLIIQLHQRRVKIIFFRVCRLGLKQLSIRIMLNYSNNFLIMSIYSINMLNMANSQNMNKIS